MEHPVFRRAAALVLVSAAVLQMVSLAFIKPHGAKK